MTKEEIALRLVESWGNQMGTPASFDRFLENYDKAIESLKKYEAQQCIE